MKSMVLASLVVLSNTIAADTVDLGVLSPNRIIVLERGSSRPDFQHYALEFQSLAPSSNKLSLVLTNDALTVEHVSVLPSGSTLMGVRSVYLDGDSSEIQLYRFSLWRGRPAPPTAHSVQVVGKPVPGGPTNLQQTLDAKRARHPSTNSQPPVPRSSIPMPESSAVAAVEAQSLPLPGGQGRTYADHMDDMVKFYERRKR